MVSVGYVSAGSLLAFSSSLPVLGREDVLSSALYMQLTSSKKYPGLENFNEWNNRYADALKFLLYNTSGRVRDGSFSSSADESVNIKSIVRARLMPLLLPDELESLELLLQRVSDLDSESEGLKILTRHSVEPGAQKSEGDRAVSRLRVQVGVVDKVAKLRVVTINLATREPIEPNFFNQSFVLVDIVGSVESECFIAQMDEDYAEFKRNTVLRSLDGRSEGEIDRLF